MEESRRLCYVGITRAKENLYMTSAEVRRVFGRTVAYPQSDFISEIKSDLREYVSASSTTVEGEGSTGSRPGYGAGYNNNPHSLKGSYVPFQNNRFAPKPATSGVSTVSSSSSPAGTSELTLGRKVKHEKFGVGTIVSASDIDGKKKLTIAFNNQGVKMLMVPPANLELL